VTREDAGALRLFCTGDVRPEIAAALVAAGAKLLRLNLLQLSLDAVYARYFEELRDAA
jgi:ABC-2 type transport system ATP-binding protein